MKKKCTSIKNEILKNFLQDNNPINMKLAIGLISKFVSRHLKYAKDTNTEYTELDIDNVITVPLSYVKKRVGRKRYTIKEYMRFIDKINVKYRRESDGSICVDYLVSKYVIYDGNVTITFNSEVLERLIIIKGEYSKLSDEVLLELKGAYDTGLYVMRSMYKGTSHGSKTFTIESAQKFLGVEVKGTDKFFNAINRAIIKLGELDEPIRYELTRYGKKITEVKFYFK